MFKFKKSQNAIEFMIIFLFLIGMISGIMYLTGIYLSESKDYEQKQRVENFADNINKEIEILAKVEPGYKRELELVSKDYEVSIIQNLLNITDNLNNKTYYFSLIGNYTIDVKNRTNEFGQNITVLIFKK
jgi:hypothetical protein